MIIWPLILSWEDLLEMRITNVGSDYIRLDEDNFEDSELINIPRVHLIKLDFMAPSATVKHIIPKLSSVPVLS